MAGRGRPGSEINITFAQSIPVARIIALDIGVKRTGIAVTDPLQMIATGLETVATADLLRYLTDYFRQEAVERIVVGEPRQMSYEESQSMPFIRGIVTLLGNSFPDKPITWVDERFTSKMALQSMRTAGARKEEMKNKETVDKVSAVLILQTYLEQKK